MVVKFNKFKDSYSNLLPPLKMRGLVFILALFSLSHPMLSEKTNIILVHGTFARDATWCNPGGDFHTELKNRIDSKKNELISFPWNGRLSAKARLEAAADLSELILEKSEKGKIIIIGHSHGGNIINLASQILSISALSDPETISSRTKKLVVSLEEVQCTEVKFLHKLIENPFVTMTRANTFLDKSKSIIPKAEILIEKLKGGSKPKWLLKRAKDFLEGTEELITSHEVDPEERHESLLNYSKNLLKKLVEKKKILRVASKDLIVNQSFLLGCPVDEKYYAPNESVIKATYNLYSSLDGVQTVFGLYRRTYSDKLKSVRNISIFYKKTPKSVMSSQPGHRGIHAPCLSRWILKIPNLLNTHGKNSKFTIFHDFSEPLISEINILEPGFFQAISQF
jgi:hypothetical protein